MDATIAFTSTNCLNVKMLKLNKVSLQAPVDLNAIKDQINLMIYHFKIGDGLFLNLSFC